jgi:2-C-methyl-D-erythritol 4-phosphate cytidylyltransferase / 2-C-methyl-D-erythritol 2,4-cyclodiphosphate synthase
MKNIALIVAAGRGSRAAPDSSDAAPKQYTRLKGKTVLQHTIDRFTALPEISNILVVIHPDDHELYVDAVGQNSKLLAPVDGADTRQGSVLAGLQALEEHAPNFVLIHDAARPFVSGDLVRRVLTALKNDLAAIPAVPIADTLRRSDKGFAGAVIPRDHVAAIQTPQVFAYRDIYNAHIWAVADGNLNLTDDSEVAARAGIPVRIVDGDRDNIKITTPADFETAARLLGYEENRRAMNVRTGTGFDVHKFTDGDHVILCGIKIPHNQSLSGHSDADVGLHALTDAILGAIGAGDIGSHFPPSDAKWRGANSALFLEHAAKLVLEKTGRINHLDVTLICEEPKIGPHREAMCQRIAEIMVIPVSRVSVKATTSEGLGFTGRKEGIAAQAVATISLSDPEE